MLDVTRWDPAQGPLELRGLRRALEHEGMATAWWSEMPGHSIAEHTHPFPESRWILSGFMRVTVGGHAVELGPGDRLDLPAGTPHAVEVVGLSPVVYVTGAPQDAVGAPLPQS
jgi:quercetin dioxygenase-like cupin family protein